MSQNTASSAMPALRPTTTLAHAHAVLDNIERQIQENEDPSVKHTECFFLDRIPGEMRNRIYEYALTCDNSVATLKFSILIPKRPYVSPEDIIAMQLKCARELKQERRELQVAYEEAQREVEAIDAQMQEWKAFDGAENRREKMQNLDGQTKEREDSTLLRNRIVREPEMLPMQTRRRKLRQDIAHMEKDFHSLAEWEKRQFERKKESESKPTWDADITVEDEYTDRRKLSFRDVDNVFALSRTCKRIRQECSGLAHEYNSFRFVTRMIEQNSSNMFDRQLKRIATRQSESREIQNGVIIDLGNCGHDYRYPPLPALNVYLTANSENLRKLHKSTDSLKLAFITGVDDRGLQEVKVEWELPLNTPDAILAYFDQKARSETRLLGEQVRSARAKVLRVFFPVWALNHGY